MTVLVLGGTGEGHALATAVDAAGVRVVSSLAGRVAAPRRPPGEVRVGGFGGPAGLRRWLVERRVDAVVDATHPFAAEMAASAAAACEAAGVPLLRLERAGWTAGPGDRWHRVADLGEAAARVDDPGRRAFLALGRGQLGAFAGVRAWCLIRSVDPPLGPLPAAHAVLVDRGPFTVEGEAALLERHAIDVVVTRDSGGPATAAKLVAARQRALPVVVVDRPARPEVETVHDVAAAVRWVREHLPSLAP